MGASKVVTSRDNPLLVRLRKLVADAGAYRKQGNVWIEGDHLCEAYLHHGGAVMQSVITDEAWERPALRELAERADAVARVPSALMKSLTALETPSSLAFLVPWQPAGALRPAAASVVLDRLQDPGNVGAIIRSAAAFGFTQVIALKGTAALWSPKVLRAGMGAHFALHLMEGVDETALDALASPLLVTSSHADAAIDAVKLPWPCNWVLGHEGQGISHSLMQRCVLALRIPQPGGEESLNAAVAAAVCMYESSRQRRQNR